MHPVIRELDGFDQQSGSLGERLLFNNRLVVVLVCLLVTLALGYQSLNLRLGASFEKMIPTNHPYIANFLANRTELAGLGNAVRIVVEARQGTIFEAAYLDTLKKISDEVFLFPGVERPYMKSLWAPATRWTGVTEEGLDGGPVIPDDYDGSAASLERVRANVERSGEVGQLVAANFKSSVVFVPLMEKDPQSGQTLDYAELSARLETLRAKYGSDAVDIHIVGFAKVVGDLIDGLRQVLMFFALAIGICTAVLFWYTRCARSTSLVVACSLV
ncbi:MAG: RND family transporter, partial [Zoogloea sp.]|nr:RND family transporter [Zoogloea sp.]